MPEHMLPDPVQTDYFLQQVTGRHGGMSWAMGRMHSWTVEASRAHAATCESDNCPTCVHFITALSLCAAVAQTIPISPEVRARLAELHERER
ncbi:hypothetical protein ACFP2T_47580 [Plantactinospora solaniradicis]|uniref:Uncharacterized protein n=1 Tax=Plantactinospora solaniradicis TaxID=1723736 RepID=A0ABW1KS39_9ACTN